MGRNQVAVLAGPISTAKALLTRKAVFKDYAEVVGGGVAGAVLPRLVIKAGQRIGIVGVAPGTLAEGVSGIIAAISAGTIYGAVTKSMAGATKVAAGGLATTVGIMIAKKLETTLPFSGMGADAAIRAEVEEEIRKQLQGMGQFVTPTDVEAAPSVSGDFGQFVTPTDIEAAPAVSGFGDDIDEGAEAFDGFDGGAY